MKIAVLCGGTSTERDVSLVSGMQVYKALKGKGHQAVLLDVYLGYDACGRLDESTAADIFSADIDWAAKVSKVSENAPDTEAVKASRKNGGKSFFGPNVIEICSAADIVFMALHGDVGENGKLQAAFDLFGIRYTGTDYISSALAMDKALTKRIFIENGVKTPESHTLTDRNEAYEPLLPVVVKVCNGGSSVGVYIANTKEEYEAALDKAFGYENKVLVEQYIKGREFTDGVIDGQALPVVEIAPKEGFYDYKNKYQAGSTVETCPADISEELTGKIQAEAVKAYHSLGIRTYARMDFIVAEDGTPYCLEANTLPGMTNTSLIPQEAAAIGVDFPSLCEWIIKISLEK